MSTGPSALSVVHDRHKWDLEARGCVAKGSVAILAAICALVAGADIAQAGLLPADADEIAAISGAEGDDGLVGDLLGDGKDEGDDDGLLDGLVGDGKGDRDGVLGDVLDDATDAVDDTLDGVGSVVEDAKVDVDKTLSGVEDTVDNKTVSGAVAAVEDIVDDTPVGGVVDDVKRSVDPVVDTLEQVSALGGSGSPAASGKASEIGAAGPLGSSAPTAQRANPDTAVLRANGAQNAAQTQLSPLSSALLEQATTPLGAPTMQLTVSTAKRIGGGPAASSHIACRRARGGSRRRIR